MVVHSTGVQWPAPHQGPHLLICGSPLPGKYAGDGLAGRPRGEGSREAAGEIVDFRKSMMRRDKLILGLFLP